MAVVAAACIPDWRLLAVNEKADGHRRVPLAGKLMHVHRLVLTAFRGPCPEGMQACHCDGDPRNNALGNLRWDTPTANHADKRKHGTHLQGEDIFGAKLTASDVSEMRSAHAAGATSGELARQFGVTKENAWMVVTRRTWRHVA